MLKNERGFSLLEVIIAAGLLGMLSIFGLRLVGNMSQGVGHVVSKYDESELRRAIGNIISDDRYCRISFAGDGPVNNPTTPVTFNKVDLDEDTEGLDISLYVSNQAGDSRTLKKFNGANNIGSEDKSKFGKLIIKEMKLIMNNGTGSNYTDALDHSDLGVLRVIVTKKTGNSTTRDITLDFDVNIGLSTGQPPEVSGETRILSCRSGGGPSALSQGTMFEISGAGGVTSNSLSLGVWSMCTLNQYRTTEDDSNNYDNCDVDGSFNGNWTLRLTKYSGDTLLCRAFCIK